MPDQNVTTEDKLLGTVEKIGEQVGLMEKSLNDRIKAIEVAQGTAVEDQKKLADHMQSVAKGAATIDETKIGEIVGKIMDKADAERARKGILGAGAASTRMTDPWDVKTDYLGWDFKRNGGSAMALVNSALSGSARTESQKYLQRMATDIAIANALGRAWERTAGEEYRGVAHHFPNMHKRWMAHVQEFLHDITGKTALDPDDVTSTANWVPTIMSSDLREKIMLECKVGALFEHIQFSGPGKTLDIPVDLTDAVADLIPETTAHPPLYSTSDPYGLGQVFVDDKVSLTPAKHRSRFIFSGELSEDAVVPIVAVVRARIARTLANGEEDCWINGQKTASIDTGGAAPGTYSIRKASDGLRYVCSAGVGNSLVDAGSDNLAYADIMAARAKMGELGVNPSDLAVIVSPSGYMQLLKIAEVLTADKFGDRATIFSGALAAVGGIPVVVSRYIPEDMNASGIRDATTTTQTIAIVVNRRAWVAAEKRDITIESVRLPQTDQTDVIAMRRLDLKGVFSSAAAISAGIKGACVIYNADTALA